LHAWHAVAGQQHRLGAAGLEPGQPGGLLAAAVLPGDQDRWRRGPVQRQERVAHRLGARIGDRVVAVREWQQVPVTQPAPGRRGHDVGDPEAADPASGGGHVQVAVVPDDPSGVHPHRAYVDRAGVGGERLDQEHVPVADPVAVRHVDEADP
jgi:hypothetical protein